MPLLTKGKKLVKGKSGKLVTWDKKKPCACCGDIPPPPPPVECSPRYVVTESPPQLDELPVFCKRAETLKIKIKIPDRFPLPCRIEAIGATDDDISIDGKIIEEGRYPYGIGSLPPDYFPQEIKCNRGHVIGEGEPGASWVFETSNREFEVYGIDNVGGNMGFSVTFCFGVQKPLSQWPKRENPFP